MSGVVGVFGFVMDRCLDGEDWKFMVKIRRRQTFYLQSRADCRLKRGEENVEFSGVVIVFLTENGYNSF
jgi:hypothetical protein